MENPKQEARYRQALDKLSKQVLHDRDVSLIDIGLNREQGRLTSDVVLRIHLRKRRVADQELGFPTQVDSIPVILIYADYEPEPGRSS